MNGRLISSTMSDSKHLKLTIKQFTEFNVYIHKFTNVSNAKNIRENLIKGSFETHDFAFINSSTVVSIEQLLSAVYRALLDYTDYKIRTKTLHSEVIFSLSPTQNIMDSLRNFGIQDNTTDLTVIKILRQETGQAYSLDIVEGEEMNVEDSEFQKTVDYKVIKKNYKIDSTDPNLITRVVVNAIQLRGH